MGRCCVGVDAVECPTVTRRYGVEQGGVEGFRGVTGLGGLDSHSEGTLSAITTGLAKWRWILSEVSYRGHMLIINNLVASSLWHKLVVLIQPTSLLSLEDSGGLPLAHSSLVQRGCICRYMRVAKGWWTWKADWQLSQRLLCHADICWGNPAWALLRRACGTGLD